MKIVVDLLNDSGFAILVVRTTRLFLLRTGDPKKRRSLGRRMGFGLSQSVSCPFCKVLTKALHVVSFAAVIRVVTQRLSPALRDDPNNSCKRD